MSIESETRAFTRTGKAWSILLLAFISWVVISLWSLKVSGYSLASLVAEPDEDSASYDIANNADSTTPILAGEKTGDSGNLGQTVTESGNEVGDLAEAEREKARIEAEESAALAEQQAAEELRLEQEAEAEAQRLAAQAEAAREQARIEAEEAAALAEQQAAEELRLEQEAEAEAQRLAAQAEAAREKARIEAEEAAALAEQQAAEELRLEQEAEAEAQRLAAQAEVAREQARIEAEEAAALARQQAAEELRLAQEAEAEAEETRLLAIAEEASVQAEEQASREREQRALELQAEAEAAEQTRLALLEQKKDESEVLDASAELSASTPKPASTDTGQNISDTALAAPSEAPDLFEGEVVVLEPQALPRASIEVAAVETDTVRQNAPSRVRQGAAAQRRASFLRLREQELKVLSGQSARIRFNPESSIITRDLERPLDRIFEPLFLYAETQVVITVSGNEYPGEMLDGELSLSRGAAIVEYLVSRGLDQERFTVQLESGEDLQLDTHRVRISAEEAVQ